MNDGIKRYFICLLVIIVAFSYTLSHGVLTYFRKQSLLFCAKITSTVFFYFWSERSKIVVSQTAALLWLSKQPTQATIVRDPKAHRALFHKGST